MEEKLSAEGEATANSSGKDSGAPESEGEVKIPPLTPFSRHTTKPATPARSAFHPDVPSRSLNIPGITSRSSGDTNERKQLQPKHLTVGRDIHLKGGEISDCEHLTLDGSVEDTVLTDAKLLEITEVGVFKGSAVVDEAVVAGRFEGELTARKRLTVCESGSISGSVSYGSIVIEPGGKVSGDMQTLVPDDTGRLL